MITLPKYHRRKVFQTVEYWRAIIHLQRHGVKYKITFIALMTLYLCWWLSFTVQYRGTEWLMAEASTPATHVRMTRKLQLRR